jgi:hypothetical protein
MSSSSTCGDKKMGERMLKRWRGEERRCHVGDNEGWDDIVVFTRYVGALYGMG